MTILTVEHRDISKMAYVSLAVAVGASITLVLPPVSLLLGITGILLSLRVRKLSVRNTTARSIANIALILSILVVVAFIAVCLGLIVTSSITSVTVKD